MRKMSTKRDKLILFAKIAGGFVKSSNTNTIAQADTATKNNPLPKYARSIAAISAAAAAIGDCVAESIAGKVITAKVTYGT